MTIASTARYDAQYRHCPGKQGLGRRPSRRRHWGFLPTVSSDADKSQTRRNICDATQNPVCLFASQAWDFVKECKFDNNVWLTAAFSKMLVRGWRAVPFGLHTQKSPSLSASLSTRAFLECTVYCSYYNIIVKPYHIYEYLFNNTVLYCLHNTPVMFDTTHDSR